MSDVIVVKTGIANTASVIAGFSRVGAVARLSEDPNEVEKASRVVLPGVGSFGAGMAQLRAAGLDKILSERILAGRPSLCVCLGLQLLLEGSEESPGVSGLGIIPGSVRRFSDQVRCPQLGWNRVEPEHSCFALQPGFAYFANSYRIVEPPPGWGHAYTEYDGRFVSAVERGAVLGCQFHPELSGLWGLGILKRWLELGGG